ncbi:Uncharacterised protein r2_g1785 [Pycnogonum litorale]
MMKKIVSEVNMDRLKFEFEATNWDLFMTIKDLNEKTRTISEYVNFCERFCTIHHVYHVDGTSNEITNDKIKYSRRKRESAFKSGNDRDFMYWTKIVDDEIANLNRVILMNLRHHNAGQYWSQIKIMSSFTTEKISPSLGDGITINTLNEFFLRFERDEEIKIHDNKGKLADPPRITEKSIENILAKLKNKSSRGPDGVSSKVLHVCRKPLAKPIAILLHQCVTEGRIPDLWKNVKITPVLKENVSVISNPKQVRPVGQTSSMLKVMEYFLREHLNHIEPHLDQQQFAYKVSVSTSDAVALLTAYCSKILDEKNTTARALFLDYSSAFNTVSWQKIIDILSSYDETPRWLINLFGDYLSPRSQYTEMDRQTSDKLPCKTGVIQGAVLSPFLFNLVTDSLMADSDNYCIIKFADDTAVVQRLKQPNDMHDYQENVNNIVKFSEDNSLILNAKKTGELVMKNRNSSSDHLNPVIVNGEVINSMYSTKYLGIVIDNELRFDNQIDSIICKAKQRLKYASIIFRKTKQNIIVTDFVRACIMPILTNCTHVYIHYVSKNKLKELCFLQRISAVCRQESNFFTNQFEKHINQQANQLYRKLKANEQHPLNDVYRLNSSKHKTRKNLILPQIHKNRAQKSYIFQMLKVKTSDTQFFELSTC